MAKITKTGKFLPVFGHEVDALMPVDRNNESLTITKLLKEASGQDVADEWVNQAIYNELVPQYSDQETIDRYRKDTGRKYPPLFNVKIEIEVEQLSEEEIEVYWKDQQERYAAISNQSDKEA
jgi:hypothetical protein